MPPVYPQSDLERLRTETGRTPEQEKVRLKKATKEFEAFFMYQLLKTMRETIPENPMTEGSPLSGGQGKEIYQQMFDMELGKRIATGGRGSISELLYNSLEKLIDAKYDTPDQQTTIRDTQPTAEPIPLVPAAVPIERPEPTPLPVTEPTALPLQSSVRPVIRDSIMARYGPLIDEAAAETKLDSALIASVIRAESNGNPSAQSQAGAKGLMQLMDSTATELGVTDSFNPKQNIMAGSRYLAQMIARFGDLKLGLAAYNAGPGNVEKHGDVPPFPETRSYVEKVTSLAKAAGSRFANRND
jgi:Rod binding domain-containing protein